MKIYFCLKMFNCLQTIYGKGCPSFTELLLCICHKSVGHISLFPGLSASLHGSQGLSHQHYLDYWWPWGKLKSARVTSLISCFFKVVLAVLVPLTFCINFKVGLSRSTLPAPPKKKILLGFIGFVLSLGVIWEELTLLLCWVSHSMNTVSVYLHLCFFLSAFCFFIIPILHVLLDLCLSMSFYISRKFCFTLPYCYVL